MPGPTPRVASRESLLELKQKIDKLALIEEREQCQESLRYFVEHSWPHVDPSPFMSNWALDAVCFPYSTKIITRDGIKTIGGIVESCWQGDVLSFNHSNNQYEWKPIIARMKSPGQSLLTITTDNSKIGLTDNHPVFVIDQGYVRADQVKVGDRVILSSVQESIQSKTQQKPLLLKKVLGCSTRVEAKKTSLNQLQELQQDSLCTAITEKGCRVLFNGLLQRVQSCSFTRYMCRLWRPYSSSASMQSLLGQIKTYWQSIFLRVLRQRCLQITGCLFADKATTWGILQSEVLWFGYAWNKTPSIYKWQQHGQLPSRILACTADSRGARWQLLFSLFENNKVGCASYRQGSIQQRVMEPCDFMPQVSSGAARTHYNQSDTQQSGRISTAIVNSVERNQWVPDAVYNIEVLDNHNYFANNVLVHNCDHLEAVMMGHIPRLLINIPPRCSKTTIVSIMFPAWIWLRYNDDLKGLLSGPQVRFLCASYSDKLSLLSSNAFRRLVKGEWYQSLYPDLRFMRDQDAKGHMDNNQRGSRQSTSVGGSLLGLGGDILIWDDLNNTETEKLVETGADRNKTKSFLDEFRSTRRNDPRDGHSAIIGVQQRTHTDDASGHWLSQESDVVHLMIPMRHDPRRHNVTVRLPQYDDPQPWEDPRDPDGEDLMWPERFGEHEVKMNEKALGPIMAAGRLQQSPKAKGGNIINRDWWMPWGPEEARLYGLQWDGDRREFPEMQLVVASLDTAQKEKEENDFNALTVWGIFLDRAKNRRAMLMYAWQGRLPLNGVEASAFPGEAPTAFQKRKKEAWGLVQNVADICRRYKVKRLLIEDKTRGHDVANEIRRLYQRENWGVQLINPVQDKVSRAHVTVPLFTDNCIYAPPETIRWVDAVITQCEEFPKSVHDDYVDSVTQFINWARENELLVMTDEMSAANEEAMTFKGKQKSVAEAYGV